MSDQIMDVLREAMEASKESRYRIAKGSGVCASQLCRFANDDRVLRLDAASKLANYLGLEIIIQSKKTKRGVK